MMKLETSKGSVLEATIVTTATIRNETRLIVELTEGTDMAQAASAFCGAQWLRASREDAPGVTTMYEGYDFVTQMTAGENGRIRVTLGRSE